jgi:hypothetical protein
MMDVLDYLLVFKITQIRWELRVNFLFSIEFNSRNPFFTCWIDERKKKKYFDNKKGKQNNVLLRMLIYGLQTSGYRSPRL